MIEQIAFSPLIPWPVFIGLACASIAVIAFAAWRKMTGSVLRFVAFLGLLLALANPVVLRQERDALTDIVILVVDETASQTLSDRRLQTEQAEAKIEAQVAQLSNTELHRVTLQDASDDRGSLLLTRVADAMADIPQGRLAGVILLSDGQIHDAGLVPDLPAPLHLLLTGSPSDWDRKLRVENAPAFAILDEEITLTLAIEDQGAVPQGLPQVSPLIVSIDGGEDIVLQMPVGRSVQVPLTLPHGGMNVLQFSVPMVEGELTDRNNSAVIQINGVRDRLRVLLVSGEPHNGERTWRNLLKSDPSVDLVHFTILRPPEKQDGVPTSELSLIPFPTRELFLDKIDDFDLIIFDRYKLRGILQPSYLENIARYVEDGGAVLFSAGPDFASADSLYRSSLSRIIPVQPTGRVIEQGYVPQISNLGSRHPVTQGLGGVASSVDAPPNWGRWFRQIELSALSGQVIMTGVDDKPLLVLDRVGEGRVAVLGSDHAWLWSRGVEGGGPQLELLRRLAHWMMKEPELEEETLSATVQGSTITVLRRSLTDDPQNLTVTAPDGTTRTETFAKASPGRFEATITGEDMGLYRLQAGDHEAVVVLGPAAPREFENTIATDTLLAGAVRPTRGMVKRLSDETPDIRLVSQGRLAGGRGWIGITPRNAYTTLSSSTAPVIPMWGWLAILMGWISFVWIREGRR
ncbi:hypothetical protein EDD53_1585 [Pacificibacter maritimus]|uniref:Glutamine amidotransferase n=1 Tax=Pacificibacter maritimus TaxID=762213 RepID=A0A3N4UIM7_9RHOB|nr:hypothetical protein [Pacificibacter maritimus]RPE67181.1 hypothetical protein EDD53_1585 [Pacificibacter maritimus]